MLAERKSIVLIESVIDYLVQRILDGAHSPCHRFHLFVSSIALVWQISFTTSNMHVPMNSLSLAFNRSLRQSLSHEIESGVWVSPVLLFPVCHDRCIC